MYTNHKSRKIIVAVTGASGAIYAKRLLEKLSEQKENVSSIGLIFSSNAEQIWNEEVGAIPNYLSPIIRFSKNDFTAPFASGSSLYDTMIVVPCSMGVIGRIASGVSDDLITRAADVILKERRKLILVTRETPFNLIHIKNMEIITLAGGIICPASPSFYNKQDSIIEIIDTVVDRILDLADFQIETKRWKS